MPWWVGVLFGISGYAILAHVLPHFEFENPFLGPLLKNTSALARSGSSRASQARALAFCALGKDVAFIAPSASCPIYGFYRGGISSVLSANIFVDVGSRSPSGVAPARMEAWIWRFGGVASRIWFSASTGRHGRWA